MPQTLLKAYVLCYNSSNGADFKLDIGLLQISLRIACQRHRQTQLDAEKTSVREAVANLFERSNFSLAPVAAV